MDIVTVDITENIDAVSVTISETVDVVTITVKEPKDGAKGDKGDPGTVAIYIQDFIIADWTAPSAGFHWLEITHGLETLLVDVTIFDASNQPVEVYREIIDSNRVLMRVPVDPDLRFDGSIWVKNT